MKAKPKTKEDYLKIHKELEGKSDFVQDPYGGWTCKACGASHMSTVNAQMHNCESYRARQRNKQNRVQCSVGGFYRQAFNSRIIVRKK